MYLQNIREKRLLTRGLVKETFLTHWKGQAGESLTNVNKKREKKCLVSKYFLYKLLPAAPAPAAVPNPPSPN